MTIKDRNLTPGTKLIGKYHKEQHTCEVLAGENGKLRYRLTDGREFKSPSAAGMAITGHPCDGWVFWSVETQNAPVVETPKEESPAAPESASPTALESAPVAKLEDAPATDTAPAAQEQTPANKSFKRTPNQRGVSEAQTRWFCQACGESFLAPYGEVPVACPMGHKG